MIRAELHCRREGTSRRTGRPSTILGLAATLALFAASSQFAVAALPPVIATFDAAKDNTLIQDPEGALSLGESQGMYAGRVGNMGGGTFRRAVIAFDLSGEIPAGSTIIDASLQLHMSQSNTGNQTVRLHRLLADWGEGPSVGFGGVGVPAEENDATWIHRFYPDVFWDNAGGDYSHSVSASMDVWFPGYYTWEGSAELVADVQQWVNQPETNFGWIMIGNEAQIQTSQRFDTREHWDPSLRPVLTVTFSPPSVPGDLNGDGAVNVSDLLLLLGLWGDCADCNNCDADLNDDCTVNVSDLLLLLGNWG